MDQKSVFLVFSLVCLSCFLYGAFVTFNSINNRKNDCSMTFMFEHPNFVVSIALDVESDLDMFAQIIPGSFVKWQSNWGLMGCIKILKHLS